MASLNQAFSNREQYDGETLADYSRALMRLYGRKEQAAADGDERKAMALLKDSSLKEKFVRGAREKWVQRELRRIEMSFKDKPFLDMREEVLNFFQDQEPMKKPRVQEVFAERADVGPTQRPMTSSHQHERRGSDYHTEISDLKKDVAQLAKSVQDLIQAQSANARLPAGPGRPEFTCFNCLKKGHTRMTCTEEMVCYHCRGKGHASKMCPKKTTEAAGGAPPSTVRPEANRGSVVTEETATKTPLSERLLAKSPTCSISIGGMDVGCVVDTGAEASIIPASFYHEELKSKLGELQDTNGLFLNVIGVGGIEIPIQGYVEVPIVVKGRQIMGSFLVVADQACATQNSSSPILLGCNILKQLTDVSILGDFTGTVPDKEEDKPKEASAKFGSIKIHPVQDEVLPPFSVRRIVCEWSAEDKTHPFNGDYVVRPASVTQKEEVTAYEGLHRLESGSSLDVLLANKSTDEVHITPTMTVA